MGRRWRLDPRVQGSEEKPAYWNWLEKHINLREVKRPVYRASWRCWVAL